MTSGPLIEAVGVSKTFRGGGLFRRGRPVHAVRGVDLAIPRGAAVGVVGESGSGKSTLGRLLLGLTSPSEGRILFEGRPIAGVSRAEWRRLRRHLQIVFQDPFGSLDPRRRVGAQIADWLAIHGLVPAAERAARVDALLRQVGLEPAHARRFPHEFPGGQRQRIGIARALAVQPAFLVADEPVSALDVSVQAQVLALLDDIRHRLGLTMLFITHDLRVAAQVCDRIAVMQRGEIVEMGDTAQVFGSPRHAYTRELLDAIPGKHWMPPRLAA